MTSRCHNPLATGYEDYGAKGIEVCEEWRDDPKAFIDWALANGYDPNLTIERKDSSGNYEPGNCEWANRTTQNRNTSRTKLTLDKARSIRRDPRLHREIALDYGIHESHVSDIKSNKVWKED